MIIPFEGFAGKTYLEGKVISARTGLPLDSVRVASVLYNTTTITDSNGQFVLTKNTHFQPETLSGNSFDEYTVQIAAKNHCIMHSGSQGNPITVSLCDIAGRTVQKSLLTSSKARFPDNRLPSGVYLLNINGQKGSRIIVTDNNLNGFIKKNYNSGATNLPHASTINDTIIFNKENHSQFTASIQDIKTNELIRLREKRWVAFDIHNHTVLTDGGYPLDTVLAHAFGKGALDVLVNSEHGGSFNTDTLGKALDFTIPRWYSLVHFSWPKILGQRTRYPGKTILQGFEWNCPGHEHASVGFIDDVTQPGAISQFEYQFDCNDGSVAMPWLPKKNSYEHTNAVAALKWLQDNFPSTSYCFVNHPSREGTYFVEHFRDFHNAAPDIFLGLEGMPGHHKNSYRGSYGGSEPELSTWGGADYLITKIGGLWDALIGEGRHLWIIVDSDFHSTGNDFWPGVYEKTHVAVTDTGAVAWRNGLKSGEMFIAHGDLISDLEFSIDDGISRAVMGSDLYTDTSRLSITIRFKSPPANNNDQKVKVDHIDLISGSISEQIDPWDPAYKSPVNTTTSVIQRFTDNEWTIENDWMVIRTMLSCTHPTYFRLRGTNLAVNTPDELDQSGNPLMDEVGMNTEEKAWNDLWFYSNPIFVYQR
jgi:hypothetical protein